MPDRPTPPSPTSQPSSHRRRTDESLRDERARTDATVRERSQEARASEQAVTREERTITQAISGAAGAHPGGRMPDGAAPLPSASPAAAVSLKQVREGLDAHRNKAHAALEEAVLNLFVSERAETDRQLEAERAEVDRDTMLRLRYLGMLGHDLRGILTIVDLQAAMLARDFVAEGADSPTFARAQGIRRAAARMRRLLDDLIDTASVDSGHLKIRMTESDLARAVVETAESYQPAARDRGVELGFEVRETPLLGIFDYERILQVLGNLVSNALKFTPRGGRVTIRAERRASSLVASVQDTGPGIPKEMADAIFEPFRQLDADERTEGIGLGLHIARSVVEAHRGEISVTSVPGEGSTFAFTLPGPPQV